MVRFFVTYVIVKLVDEKLNMHRYVLDGFRLHPTILIVQPFAEEHDDGLNPNSFG